MGTRLVFSKGPDDLLFAALGEGQTESILDRLLSAAANENETIPFLLCAIDGFEGLASRRSTAALKKAVAGLIGILHEQTPENVYIDCSGVNEFLLVLPSVSQEKAIEFGEELQRRFAAMAASIRTRPALQANLSVSCAIFPRDAQSSAELMRLLRETIYAIREEGGEQVRLAKAPMLVPLKAKITELQSRFLDEAASAQDSSVDSIVREAIDLYLNRK